MHLTTLLTPLLSLLTTPLTTLALLPPAVKAQYIKTIDPLPAPPHAVTIDFLAPSAQFSDLTAPKLDEINTTVFEWWYFDAISSANPNASLVFTFFTATATGFPLIPPNASSVLLTYVWATMPDGRVVVDRAVPGDAAVLGEEGRSAGLWEGTGGWISSVDLGGKGMVEAWVGWEGGRLHPPTTPCSNPNAFDPSLILGPYLGWVDLVPAARAVVDVVVDGQPLQFTGYGYHDKNWGSRPFQTLIKTWSWGHATVGAYSLVWFQYHPAPGLDPANPNSINPVISAYLARDGQVLISGCEAGIVNVTEKSAGGRYAVEMVMQGVRLDVQGVLLVAGDAKYYSRWNGRVGGVVLGERVGGGVAVFETFQF
ncbi:hypothetical protein BO71DRAFT_453457 [Aspergillus ellipticus CBS 707.79]|uniref:AttH domain-containing protein n=1 Tax=Aspergillus ellipticus CBS 707.79 TaxID=1448320 RepID=A0A319DEE0_9EURO|nr:hypothetical protein BO71DRAFT_453457 [Aspergillus ellipticus CBS 707.79]